MTRCYRRWQDSARFDKILRSLGAEFRIVIEFSFISKMGARVWPGVIKCDKMWQDVKAY